jgi:hypothetical protein
LQKRKSKEKKIITQNKPNQFTIKNQPFLLVLGFVFVSCGKKYQFQQKTNLQTRKIWFPKIQKKQSRYFIQFFSRRKNNQDDFQKSIGVEEKKSTTFY